MILYCTKKTIKTFNIPMVEELSYSIEGIANNVLLKEKDDFLLEWGLKIFYFDGRKCIQAMNFASKFTLFIFDIHNNEIKEIGNIIANYLIELYKEDYKVSKLLKKLFKEHPICVFSKLTNKSIISSLNTNEYYFCDYRNNFYNYIENGILKTMEINKDVNWNNIVTVFINGKKEYVFSSELFKSKLLERYKK